MAHLIDASSLIEAKDRYYGFDFCPGFWDWLEQEYQAGRLYSIDRIKVELEKGTDALTEWAQARPDFFLPLDAGAIAAVTSINTWIVGAGFRQQAVTDFLGGADPFLIAFAQTHGHTVVTDEILIPGEKKKVKIPAVCAQFEVPCISPFEMLRNGGARLIL
jgi:hypothetical protein